MTPFDGECQILQTLLIRHTYFIFDKLKSHVVRYFYGRILIAINSFRFCDISTISANNAFYGGANVGEMERGCTLAQRDKVVRCYVFSSHISCSTMLRDLRE